MPTHETIEGESLTYDEPPPLEAAFLERVRQAASDPAVTEDALVALLYGKDNPLLDHARLPGHSLVTADTLKNPLYRVLCDYLGQKRVQTGALDLAAAAARYTLTVTEAGERLGIHPSAVRQAIAAGRLPSWKKSGQHFLDPASVASFQIARRGPSPRLQIRCGKEGDVAFRVKTPGDLDGFYRPALGVSEGTLVSWKRIGVIFTNKANKSQFFVLEPGGEDNEVKHGSFYVRGRFVVAEKIHNSQKAVEAWDAFTAE